jgi:hypothetical protein
MKIILWCFVGPSQKLYTHTHTPIMHCSRSYTIFSPTYSPPSTSRDSSVGIATWLRAERSGSRARFPTGAGNFSLHNRVQTGSGARPASCPVCARGSFAGGKASVVWGWRLTSMKCRGQECVELYLHSPNRPLRCGAHLKHRYSFTNFTRTFVLVGWRLVKHRDNFTLLKVPWLLFSASALRVVMATLCRWQRAVRKEANAMRVRISGRLEKTQLKRSDSSLRCDEWTVSENLGKKCGSRSVHLTVRYWVDVSDECI